MFEKLKMHTPNSFFIKNNLKQRIFGGLLKRIVQFFLIAFNNHINNSNK